MSLQCETVISDAVLQAARHAIPADAHRWLCLPGDSLKNEPLLPLLIGLLDATKAVANAVADNSWDDCRPVDKQLASDLARAAQETAAAITSATQCPDASTWSLPSASGKELV